MATTAAKAGFILQLHMHRQVSEILPDPAVTSHWSTTTLRSCDGQGKHAGVDLMRGSCSAGVKWGEIGNKWSCPYCRTCRFDNVCLNHTSLAVQFYQDPQDPTPLFYDFIGQPHNTFPADFINTGAPLLSSCHCAVNDGSPAWVCCCASQILQNQVGQAALAAL